MSAVTITLNGITKYDCDTHYPYFAIRNDSEGVVYASTTNPECTPDAEGVVSIASGDGYMAANTDNDNTCLYLSGTGKVTVIAQHDKIFPFKVAQGGGDGGTASGSVVGLQIEKWVDELVSACVSVSTLPYSFYGGAAVVFNNEIHILGGTSNGTKHYKYNGSSWESVSTLPYSFSYGAAVVFNNEIHILGGTSNVTKHYKYNGSSWESVSTLPYSFYGGAAVVWGNSIYILGGVDTDNSTKWYNYKSTSGWHTMGTLPYRFGYGSVVVFNNYIHIMGSQFSGQSRNHYKFFGGIWCDVSTLSPGLSNLEAAVIFNSEIYYLAADKLNIVKNDNRHIATMLPKGAHIMLSDNEDINYVKNAEKISSNIAEVTETGYVEVLASMPEIYAAKGYLTFY